MDEGRLNESKEELEVAYTSQKVGMSPSTRKTFERVLTSFEVLNTLSRGTVDFNLREEQLLQEEQTLRLALEKDEKYEDVLRRLDELDTSRMLLKYGDYMSKNLRELAALERDAFKGNILLADKDWRVVLEKLRDEGTKKTSTQPPQPFHDRIDALALRYGRTSKAIVAEIATYQNRNDKAHSQLEDKRKEVDPAKLGNFILQERRQLISWPLSDVAKKHAYKEILLTSLDEYATWHFSNYREVLKAMVRGNPFFEYGQLLKVSDAWQVERTKQPKNKDQQKKDQLDFGQGTFDESMRELESGLKKANLAGETAEKPLERLRKLRKEYNVLVADRQQLLNDAADKYRGMQKKQGEINAAFQQARSLMKGKGKS